MPLPQMRSFDCARVNTEDTLMHIDARLKHLRLMTSQNCKDFSLSLGFSFFLVHNPKGIGSKKLCWLSPCQK